MGKYEVDAAFANGCSPAHRATHVPVGQDQKQHLEFGRECAQSFNSTYGEILTVPEVIICKYKDIHH
jgi:tryptophanyl-tRNA synthetase